jgi:hypothetical protein
MSSESDLGETQGTSYHEASFPSIFKPVQSDKSQAFNTQGVTDAGKMLPF